MITFKQFLENLWGEIPVTDRRKPSDGIPNAQKLSMSSTSKGASGGMAPMAGAPMSPEGMKMMKKKMKK